MPNGWVNQDLLRFFFEAENFKKEINMFECMESVKYIYESVIQPYTKNPSREYSNCASCSSKIRGRDTFSKTNHNMVRAGKRKTRYI